MQEQLCQALHNSCTVNRCKDRAKSNQRTFPLVSAIALTQASMYTCMEKAAVQVHTCTCFTLGPPPNQAGPPVFEVVTLERDTAKQTLQTLRSAPRPLVSSPKLSCAGSSPG